MVLYEGYSVRHELQSPFLIYISVVLHVKFILVVFSTLIQRIYKKVFTNTLRCKIVTLTVYLTFRYIDHVTSFNNSKFGTYFELSI